MKILVSILLLVFAVTTGFAQSSTPDYIQKAKVGLAQYYPQFKDYFEPIFAKYSELGSTTHNIFNSKIHENFDTFEEELTTDRDKCATILTAMDDILGDKTYINSKKEVDSSDGEDLIKLIASEITSDIKIKYAQELAKVQEKLAKEQAKMAKIKELTNDNGVNENNPKQLLISIEKLFEIVDLSEIKEESKIQELISGYIGIGKRINHTPSPLGQKFIDEYNRITKSK